MTDDQYLEKMAEIKAKIARFEKDSRVRIGPYYRELVKLTAAQIKFNMRLGPLKCATK